jgi:hypothetical protein
MAARRIHIEGQVLRESSRKSHQAPPRSADSFRQGQTAAARATADRASHHRTPDRHQDQKIQNSPSNFPAPAEIAKAHQHSRRSNRRPSNPGHRPATNYPDQSSRCRHHYSSTRHFNTRHHTLLHRPCSSLRARQAVLQAQSVRASKRICRALAGGVRRDNCQIAEECCCVEQSAWCE